MILLGLLSVGFFTGCSNEDTPTGSALENSSLTETDKDALLFMLEEEKLARDTYAYLDGLYNKGQFAKIKSSEQSHMDAIANLLEQFGITYYVMPHGEFSDTDIQELYDQFILKGTIDSVNALEVGATIEDLDIVDLESYITDLSNPSIIGVFELLQCGSRNHLRGFTSALNVAGISYTPQFLTANAYDLIIRDANEQCGK